jgi:hypothetical protein
LASSIVRTPDACQVITELFELATLPSHFSFAGSYWAPLPPRSWYISNVALTAAMTVPSLAATL